MYMYLATLACRAEQFSDIHEPHNDIHEILMAMLDINGRAIPMIAFHRLNLHVYTCIFVYIHVCFSLTCT